MTYRKLWDAARVREVLSTESRQKSHELFLRTHSPFRRIRLDFCKELGNYSPFITEDDIYTIIHTAPLDAPNRLFFVVGEAGSGKSELCQWLEYMADNTTRIPIHIPRSMTRAIYVARLLRSRLGIIASDHQSQHAPPGMRARHAALTALMLLYEQGNDTLQPAAKWEALLTSERLAEHLVLTLSRTEDLGEKLDDANQAMPLLNSEVFKGLCTQYGIVLPECEAPLMCEALNSLVGQALEHVLWLSDLRALLSELSDRAIVLGKRPLLLIEDITAFQASGDLLLDYLLDLTSGHFDAVIGLTTGFEQSQLARNTLDGDLTHIHQRLRARFVLTDEDGQAYSLEDTIVEFARTYLQEVKSSPALPTITHSTSFTTTPDADNVIENDLYPFTDVALRRAFSCLREDGNRRQTPRLFIEHVLAAVLLADDIPPRTLDHSIHLEQPPTLFRHLDTEDEQLQSVLRWYGTIEENAVTMDQRLATAWGIQAPTDMMVNGRLHAPRSYRGTPQDEVFSPTHTWQQELRELQCWLDHGGAYPSRETLKRGVEQVMLQLGDPRSLADRDSLSVAQAEIYYARGDERLPISLTDNSGDIPGDEVVPKVTITRHPRERRILEELFYYALNNAELADTSENVALTLSWAQEHWDTYHGQIRTLLATRLNGVTAEQFIFTTWRCLAALAGRSWMTGPSIPRDAESLPYRSTTPWDEHSHESCFRAGEALYSWLEVTRRLFIGAFAFRDTLLNLQGFTATATSIDVDSVLRNLALLSVAKLRTIPFKIRPMNANLHDLLVPLQRYAAALLELDGKQQLQNDLKMAKQRAGHLKQQLHIDMAAFRAQTRLLHAWCGQVGVSWRMEWDDAITTLNSLSTDELTALHAQVQDAVDIISARLRQDMCTVWDYQEIRHRLRPIQQHRYWAAETALQTLLRDLKRVAQDRFPRSRRTFVGTESYRELRATLRDIHEVMSDA